jgi:hypothetical protein
VPAHRPYWPNQWYSFPGWTAWCSVPTTCWCIPL